MKLQLQDTQTSELGNCIIVNWWDKKIRATLQQICLNQIISENKPYNLCLCIFTLLNFKRKIGIYIIYRNM